MFRDNPTVAAALVTTGDLVAILLAWIASRNGQDELSPVAMSVVVIAHQLVMSSASLHTQLRTVSAGDLFARILGSWFRSVLVLGLVGMLRPEWVPHRAAFAFALLFLVLLSGVRFGTMFLRHWVRRRGRNLRSVVIAGTGSAAAQIDAAMSANPGWGLRVAGFLAPPEPAVTVIAPERVIGSYPDLERVLRERVVDEIVVADPDSSMATSSALVEISHTLGLRTHVVANFLPSTWRGVDARKISDNIVLSLTPFPHDVFGLSVKRAIDIAVSLTTLVVLAPLFLLLAVAIRLDSRGPILFRQRRVGLNGRLFMFPKFRTMQDGAEAQVPALEERNEMDGPVFKIRNDPRVTRVGRWLRRFSLDELPQLWNVLHGDMSLVGPRPLRPHEIDGHLSWQRRRLSMRPGLTCLWQVSGRNLVSFDRWMRLDLEYIDSWSLGLDFRILARTVPAVLSGKGAS